MDVMVQVGTVLTALVDMDVRTGVDSGSDVAGAIKQNELVITVLRLYQLVLQSSSPLCEVLDFAI